MTDLVIRGGTVVTATGSRRADVAVRGGVIEAIEPDLAGPAAGAAEVVDATGLLVLPGVVDVHTHTRVASDAEPDRFFQDSVAAAFGGTTTFLAFNNPGTGSSAAAERSLLTGRPRVARRDRRRQRHRLRAEPRGQWPRRRPAAELPATIEAGVATSKAFMVFDFRLPDDALVRRDGRHGRARRDARRSTARTRSLLDAGDRRSARSRGDGATLPRELAAAVCRGGRHGPGAGASPARPTRRSTSSTSHRPPRSRRSAARRRPGSG